MTVTSRSGRELGRVFRDGSLAHRVYVRHKARHAQLAAGQPFLSDRLYIGRSGHFRRRRDLAASYLVRRWRRRRRSWRLGSWWHRPRRRRSLGRRWRGLRIGTGRGRRIGFGRLLRNRGRSRLRLRGRSARGAPDPELSGLWFRSHRALLLLPMYRTYGTARSTALRQSARISPVSLADGTRSRWSSSPAVPSGFPQLSG